MADFFLPLESAMVGQLRETPGPATAAHVSGLRLSRDYASAGTSWAVEICGPAIPTRRVAGAERREFALAQVSLDRAQMVAMRDAIDAALTESEDEPGAPYPGGNEPDLQTQALLASAHARSAMDAPTQACPAPHERVVAMVSDASCAQLYVGLLGELRRVTPAEEDLLVYRIQVIVALDSWWRRMSASAREAALRLVREDRDLRFFLLTSSIGDPA
jgi:hypothetical protein